MKPLTIGSLLCPGYAALAPMAGFTDEACRRLMAAHGAAFTVSEMVSARALTYDSQKTVGLLRSAPNAAPYGVQLFGSDPETMGQAAALIAGERFDFYDINMGCPAPKITGRGAADGSGSALMRDPDRCGRIVEAVVRNAGTRPVTVKMRKGWDSQSVTAVQCAQAVAQAGAALITVHARTQEEQYRPGIDLDIIAAVRQAVPAQIPVLGNGDITTPQDALRMVQYTGCDGVMVGRGALGNPWLLEQINALLSGQPLPKEPNLIARMNAMRAQLQDMVRLKGEWAAMPQARGQALHYMKGMRGASALRKACCELQHEQDIEDLIALVFEQQRKAPAGDPADADVPFP